MRSRRPLGSLALDAHFLARGPHLLMHGDKTRGTRPGELDFHLLGEHGAGSMHDDEWRRRRAEQLMKRHERSR